MMIVVLFRWFDGPSLVIFVGALGCVSALLFATDAGNRRGQVLSLVAAALLITISVGNAVRAAQQDPFVRITWAKEQPDPKHRYEFWNAFSRVTADGNPDAVGPPSGNGLSPKTPPSQIGQMAILIDSTAGTAALSKGDHSFLRYDISNLAYHARPQGDAAVVGVGGGRDVLSALEFGANSVTGIEINQNILDLVNGTLGGFTGHLDRNPKVKFVNDEARQLADTEQRQVRRPTDLADRHMGRHPGGRVRLVGELAVHDGCLGHVPRPPQAGRHPHRLPLVFAARQRTARDLSHGIPRGPVVDEPGCQESARPHADLQGSRHRVGRRRHHPRQPTALLRQGPGHAHRDGEAARVHADPHAHDLDRRALRTTRRPGGPGPALKDFNADVSAPTDDRPFFFQMVDFKQVLKGEGFSSQNNIFRAVWVLTILAITVIGLAAMCIAFPLLVSWRRAVRRGERMPPGMGPFYALFAAIGLGFLLIEISQLQRLGVFLGHPTYALTVVLFTVLVFSGIGSLLTDRFVDPDRPVTIIGPFVGLLVLLGLFGVIAPAVTDSMASSTTPMRIAAAVALLAPVAVGMGMPFAIGMALASRTPKAPVAYFWGINGAMSVVASVLGATIALFFGITASFLSGVVAYVAATAAITVAALRSRSQHADAVDPESVESEAPKVLVDATWRSFSAAVGGPSSPQRERTASVPHG